MDGLPNNWYQSSRTSLAPRQNMANTSMTRVPLYKVILVGEVGVGKSSVYTRFKKDHFNPLGTPTIGVDSFTEQLFVDGEHCKVGSARVYFIFLLSEA